MLTSHTSFKAQVTGEFIYLLGTFTFFLVAFIAAYQWRNTQIQEQNMIFELQRIGDEAANQVNLAHLSGDGFSKEYYLPEKIAGFSYNIVIYGNILRINTSKTSYSLTLITANINGNFSIGKNIIKNIRGVVNISA
ncbi:MAG: hypothetical protein NZ942_01275 [Candidatus Aenigmarchaeota archaeon]|nr:hypothetical protein [Candidatus Aenigmarchaeota archaeon]